VGGPFIPPPRGCGTPGWPPRSQACRPTRLRDLASAPLPFEVREGRLTGDCSGVDLNAIAKGAAVDASVIAAVGLADVTAVLVNAGGDLRRHGPGSVVVDVGDPGDPHDDAPALATWELSQGAVATSSGVRRGFRVGERWYGHVLDPRTGLPIAGTLQATVVAPDAATADAAATAALVLPPDDARDLLLREGCQDSRDRRPLHAEGRMAAAAARYWSVDHSRMTATAGLGTGEDEVADDACCGCELDAGTRQRHHHEEDGGDVDGPAHGVPVPTPRWMSPAAAASPCFVWTTV
jgi:hypothetical protein